MNKIFDRSNYKEEPYKYFDHYTTDAFSFEGKYSFISSNSQKRDYSIYIYACCEGLYDDIERYYKYDDLGLKTNYREEHITQNWFHHMELIIYDEEIYINNKIIFDKEKVIYRMSIYPKHLKNINFSASFCKFSGYMTIDENIFKNYIYLYNDKPYFCKEEETYPRIKLKRIFDDVYFILFSNYIYIIERKIKCNFIYYDELYYTDLNGLLDDELDDELYLTNYVFSQGKTYILSNSGDKNAIIFAKYIDPSYECYEKKEVLLYREYYAIIHAFAFLITHPIDSIKKNIKPQSKKINLSHELWDFIYFEYFANMISLK